MDQIKCEAFLAAIDSGSLTAAGQLLGYSQSGITRMILSLEEELGFPLFIRSRKGVSPTANGAAMIPAFREIVRAHKYAAELGTDIRGVIQGALTIGCYYSVSAHWLPEILMRFQQQYPNVIINMREGTNQELSHWLNEKSVDCCFSAEPSKGTICDWIPIRDDELLAWIPEDHPMANEKSFPLQALNDNPFIITRPGKDTDIDRLVEEDDLHPDIRFSTADAYTTYCMVSQGLGVSLDNRLVSMYWHGHVATLPFDPPRFISLGIAVPCLKEASPATKRFIECVKQTMEQLP